MKNFLLCFGILLISFSILSNCARQIKAEEIGLFGNTLPNGTYLLENNKIRIVVAPQYGGRVLSISNKTSGEELVEPLSDEDISIGGSFYDIVNLVWPGSAEVPYSVNKFDLDTKNNQIFIELEYSVGKKAPEKRGLVITRRIWLDNFSTAVFSETSIKNNARHDLDFTYWHQSRPILGEPEEGGRITWLPIDDDIFKIPFAPGSGGHGTSMMPSDGFVGLTAKEASSSAVWLFDRNKINYFWTWHDVQVPTYDILFKMTNLKPGESETYRLDIAFLPDVPAITGGNFDTGLVSGITANFENRTIFLEGFLYKYTKGDYKNQFIVEYKKEVSYEKTE